GGEITYKEIKIMKFGKGGSASKYKDCTVVDNKKILCVFRDKDVTKYYVEATVADNARQYPAKAADDATSASLSKDWTDENCGINTRTIRAYFTVIPSRLDYRVLERDIRH
ncbi:MAG: hypothetical protein J6Z11_07735, partial [Candidatus Riflebacteria bacterium]|nr:hypothetical protein [Candidatus Riflebacteria bacterium]